MCEKILLGGIQGEGNFSHILHFRSLSNVDKLEVYAGRVTHLCHFSQKLPGCVISEDFAFKSESLVESRGGELVTLLNLVYDIFGVLKLKCKNAFSREELDTVSLRMKEINSQKTQPCLCFFVDKYKNRFSVMESHLNAHSFKMRECSFLDVCFSHTLVAIVNVYNNLVCR